MVNIYKFRISYHGKKPEIIKQVLAVEEKEKTYRVIDGQGHYRSVIRKSEIGVLSSSWDTSVYLDCDDINRYIDILIKRESKRKEHLNKQLRDVEEIINMCEDFRIEV